MKFIEKFVLPALLVMVLVVCGCAIFFLIQLAFQRADDIKACRADGFKPWECRAMIECGRIRR